MTDWAKGRVLMQLELSPRVPPCRGQEGLPAVSMGGVALMSGAWNEMVLPLWSMTFCSNECSTQTVGEDCHWS